MACLRSFSRKSLYPKWFSCKILSPDVLHQQHVRDYPESSSPYSRLLVHRFHRHALLDDRKKTAFGSTSESSSGLLLCRHMSSEPEESYSKIDAFENTAGELVSEKTVEAVATNVSTPATENFSFPGNLINGMHELTCFNWYFSFPGNWVEFVINGIHESTGFNWWISIVITAFLVNGLMSPVSVRVLRRSLESKILRKAFLIEDQQIKVINDFESYVEDIIRLVALMEKSKEAYLYFLTFFLLDATIYGFFMDGIGIMAKKIPELSTSDSLYILPLMTGFTIWLTSEINKSGSKLAYRMMRLPLFPIIFIALQHIFEFEPAVYGFVIPSTIYLSYLFQKSKANEKGMQAYISGLGRGMKIQKGSMRSFSLTFSHFLPTKIVLKINGKAVRPW